MSAAVPVIDIGRFIDGTDRPGVVREIGAACEDIGFLVVSGHGVDHGAVAGALEQARAFFHLPAEEKQRYAPAERWFFRGYESLGGSALAKSLGEDSAPDLCELFRISRFDDPAVADAAGACPGLEYFFAPNIWPERPVGLRDALTRYYAELERLAATMMRIFALALDLPESFFDDKIDRHITNLAINYYPPQPTAPLPGQLRRGAHSDYGSMTILYQDDAPGGLQVLTKDGRWADVAHLPGTYVVNIGDLMAHWTNDRWVSTMHRVVNLPREQADRERLSMPFFHQPNHDAVIECLPSCQSPTNPPRHPPVTSGEWVRTKTRRQVGVE